MNSSQEELERGRQARWQRTVTKELKDMGLSWSKAQAKAQDRGQLLGKIAGLCSSRDEEDK